MTKNSVMSDTELWKRTSAQKAWTGEKLYEVYLIPKKEIPAVRLWLSAKNALHARKIAHEWAIRRVGLTNRSYSLNITHVETEF